MYQTTRAGKIILDPKIGTSGILGPLRIGYAGHYNDPRLLFTKKI